MKFNIHELQKKGQAGLDAKMTSLIGAVILIFLVAALAPEIFTQLATLGAVDSDAPAWLYTVLVVIVGAGLVFLIWRAMK